jgi:stalled ribosome alternative rescue factor ArfA
LEFLKRAEEGEVVEEKETTVVAEDDNKLTIEDPLHKTHRVKQNNVSKGSHTRKAKMIKTGFFGCEANALSKCEAQKQEL